MPTTPDRPAQADRRAAGELDWSFPTIEPAAPYTASTGFAQLEGSGPVAAPVASPGISAPPSAPVLPVPRRQRTGDGPVAPMRALAGALVAVAGVLLGIGALLWATEAPSGTPALRQPQADSSLLAPAASAAATASAQPVTATPAPLTATAAAPSPVPPPRPPLTVLNNSRIDGLAARAAASYRTAGWPVRAVASFRGLISVTTVYYEPGQQAAALLLQRAFPAIERVRPRFAGLPGTGLTVVLTRAYPG